MSKEAKLKGVAHNAMDHAVSGLGFLTPHLTQYCAASGARCVRLSLLSSESVSSLQDLPKPLVLAAQACQEKFAQILASAGFQSGDVITAHLEFESQGGEAFTCRCVLHSARGKEFIAEMNSETYWSSKREDPFDALRKLRHGRTKAPLP